MINGLPFDHAIGFGDGVAAAAATAMEGIKSGDNLIAVFSWVPSTGVVLVRDATDFTVTDGVITGATIDLSAAGTKLVAIWTNAPAA